MVFDLRENGCRYREPHKFYNSAIHYFTQNMSNRDTPDETEHAHLADLSDGAGCTEIWEHLSQSRDE